MRLIILFLLFTLTLFPSKSVFSNDLCEANNLSDECIVPQIQHQSDSLEAPTDNREKLERNRINNALLNYYEEKGNLGEIDKLFFKNAEMETISASKVFAAHVAIAGISNTEKFEIVANQRLKKIKYSLYEYCPSIVSNLITFNKSNKAIQFAQSKSCRNGFTKSPQKIIEHFISKGAYSQALSFAQKFSNGQNFEDSLLLYNLSKVKKNHTKRDLEQRSKIISDKLNGLRKAEKNIQKGISDSSNYLRAFARSYLNADSYDDFKRVVSEDGSLLSNPLVMLDLIDFYLRHERFNDVLVWADKLNDLPDNQKSYMTAPQMLVPSYKRHRSIGAKHFENLFGNIPDERLLELAHDTNQYYSHSIIDVATMISETKGSNYLNSLKIKQCRVLGISFLNNSLYDCLTTKIKHDPVEGYYQSVRANRALLDVAFGKNISASLQVGLLWQKQKTSNRLQIEKAILLALDHNQCEFGFLPWVFSFDALKSGQIINNNHKRFDLSVWDYLQAACLAQNGNAPDFIGRMSDQNKRVAYSKVVIEETRRSHRASSNKLLEILPLLPQTELNRRQDIYNIFWINREEYNAEEKYQAYQKAKEALQYFNGGDLLLAQKKFFWKIYAYDDELALQYWNENPDFKNDAKMAETYVSMNVKTENYERGLSIYKTLPLDIQKNVIAKVIPLIPNSELSKENIELPLSDVEKIEVYKSIFKERYEKPYIPRSRGYNNF